MQFKVPQDVQREDRIVGPLTLRQLIVCGIGFSLCYAIFTILGRDYELVTVLIPVIIIGLVTVVFAFIRPLDLSFERYVLYRVEAIVLPSKRYWIKGTADPSRLLYVAASSGKKKNVDKALEKDLLKKKRSISELTQILDHKVK